MRSSVTIFRPRLDAMSTDVAGGAQALCCSLHHVQLAFAHESVNVVRYLPPLVDPASTEIDDIYAWLHILPVEPGWLLRDTLWVCESADLSRTCRCQHLGSCNKIYNFGDAEMCTSEALESA